MQYYQHNNLEGIIESSDDVLNLPAPIGAELVQQRLDNAPWLAEYIRHRLAPRGEESYIDAYNAVARMLAIASVIRSTHPDDLGYALGLPIIFVRLVILALRSADWERELLPEMILAASREDVGLLNSLIEEFVMVEFYPKLEWLDILKAVGVELLGVGKPPFGKCPESTPEEYARWRATLSEQEASVWYLTPAAYGLLN